MAITSFQAFIFHWWLSSHFILKNRNGHTGIPSSLYHSVYNQPAPALNDMFCLFLLPPLWFYQRPNLCTYTASTANCPLSSCIQLDFITDSSPKRFTSILILLENPQLQDWGCSSWYSKCLAWARPVKNNNSNIKNSSVAPHALSLTAPFLWSPYRPNSLY